MTVTTKNNQATILNAIWRTYLHASSAPTSLLTESQTNPTSVTNSYPRFSAIYNDPDAGDTSGKYRIQVSTSSAFATTLWDSGTTTMATTTESTRSPDITYAGSTSLASSTTYYWRIKFWDASTTESVWSTATSTFILANIQYAQNWVYTKIGNISTSSSQGEYLYANTGFANPHAPTSINGVSLIYDNNGNVLTYGSKAYTWDYRNRMTQAGNGTATSTYGYDYGGNRVTLVDTTGTTKYANRFYSTNGATTTKYIYAGDTLIATVEKIGNATTTHIVHPDHLGGSNIITDASGNVVETLDYYPFGSIRTDTRTGSFDERKKYIGEQYDTATSLSYLNARYYDGTRGQFLSQDPVSLGDPTKQDLGDPQNLNSYSYARDNPIVYRDPTGKFGVLALMGIGALVGLTAQGIEDYTAGRQFQWQNYAGSAAGGAMGSLALVGSVAAGTPTLAPYIAGGVGGATKEVISQSVKILTGEQTQHEWAKVGFEGGLGIGTGLLPVPQIAGVNVGQNSFQAIESQITTKLAGNTIQNFTAQTGSKILTSQFISSGARAAEVGIGSNSSVRQTVLAGIQAQINSIQAQINALLKSRK